LSESAIDQISIEGKRDDLSPAVLANTGSKAVVLGCVDVGTTEVESEDEITAQARAALAYIDPSRLILAPDCGMVQLTRGAARAKLARLAAAAASLQREVSAAVGAARPSSVARAP
jgi:5-methyltetrahydropteroyltriglutamate--homocysteine methyltransferase